MKYNATSNQKNNMINFINSELPDIFCAQELSWFYPNQREGYLFSHRMSKSVKNSKKINLKGYYEKKNNRTKNIAWCGGTNIVLIYWNPEIFEIDPLFPLTEVNNENSILRVGNVPRNKNNKSKLALSSFNRGRPAVGVRLIPKWNPESRFIIVCVHLEHYHVLNYTQDYIYEKIHEILDALDYNESIVTNIAIMGDFNEYYEKFRNKIFTLKNNAQLHFNPKLKNGNWPTINNRPFDLFYSNFEPHPQTEVRFKENNSDHKPIVTTIKKYNSSMKRPKRTFGSLDPDQLDLFDEDY